MATEDAVKFLRMVRERGPWTVGAMLPGRAPVSLTTYDEEELFNFIDHHNDDKHNLYYNPNPAKTPSSHRETKAKLGKSMVARVEYLQADYDRTEDGRRLVLVEGAKEALVTRLLNGEIKPGVPTSIVDSGNGIQVLWKLADPFDINTGDVETDRSRLAIAECHSASIAAISNGDHCWACNHLFRLPGTTNVPDKRKEEEGLTKRPTSLLHFDANISYDTDIDDVPYDPALKETYLVGEVTFGLPQIVDPEEIVHRFNLPTWLAIRIEAEVDPSRRSQTEFNLCLSLFEHGVPPEIVHGVLLNQDLPISERTYDKGRDDPEAYSRRTVINALEKFRKDSINEFEPIDESVYEPVEDPTEDLSSAEQELAEALDARDPDRWKVWRMSELTDLPPVRWTIKDVLIEQGLTTVVSKPGIGKTYFSVEMALCIATGRPFFGLPVERGKVLYVIAEGNRSAFINRVDAWLKHNEVSREDVEDWFFVIFEPILLDTKDVTSFLSLVGEVEFAAVFFDTLNASMAGDENETYHMTRMLRGAALFARRTESAIVLIHHTGHEGTRERGAIALRGRADNMLMLEPVEGNKHEGRGVRVAYSYKEREGKKFGPVWFDLAEVITHTDQETGEITEGYAIKQVEKPVEEEEEAGSQPSAGKGKKAPRAEGRFVAAVTTDHLLADILARDVKDVESLVDERKQGRSRKNINRLLDRMRTFGWLEPRPTPRSSAVELTQEGRRLAEELYHDLIDIPDTEQSEDDGF